MIYLIHAVLSISFNVDSNDKLCLGETALNGDILMGTFKYNQNSNAKLESMSINIEDPLKNIKYSSKDESGSFSIETQKNGVYNICFWNKGRFTRSVTIELKNALKKVNNKNKAKKKHIEPLQQQMLNLLDSAKHLRNDLEYLKEREFESRDLNESTNSRVLWSSFLSIFIFIIAGITKIMYLKSFFTKKKLI